MKTKTYRVYKFDELSDESKQKAINKCIESNEYHGLKLEMEDFLSQLLEEYGIKGEPKIYYSLSYSQGDGAMFEGDFEWNMRDITISQVGRYTHSNSKEISFASSDVCERIENEFEKIYQEICNKLEKYGYSCIEYEDSEEAIIEAFEANDCYFTVNGDID